MTPEQYIVPEETKKIWAVELDLLQVFLAYCEKHHLRCWVEGGTLLGAVRHKGFIPWDDDVDLTMPREDYDRMCQIGNEGLEAPYFLQTAYSDTDYYRSHAQFRRTDTAAIRPSDCFQPFCQGIFIDIFPLEAAPDYKEMVHEHCKRFRKTLKFLKAKNVHCISSGRLTLIFRKLKARRAVRKYGWANIFRKGEDEMRALAAYPHTKVGELLSMGEDMLWDKSIFDETVMLPFEHLMVPAPKEYDQFLRIEFGDNYMTPVMAPSMHGQVVFDTERSYTEVLPEVRKAYRWSAPWRLLDKIFPRRRENPTAL